jgi:hypothetical protein
LLSPNLTIYVIEICVIHDIIGTNFLLSTLYCCFRYLSMKAALLEPSTLHLLSQFQKATCVWLTQVVLDVDKDFKSNDLQSYCPNKFLVIEFPLPSIVPPTLK